MWWVPDFPNDFQIITELWFYGRPNNHNPYYGGFVILRGSNLTTKRSSFKRENAAQGDGDQSDQTTTCVAAAHDGMWDEEILT